MSKPTRPQLLALASPVAIPVAQLDLDSDGDLVDRWERRQRHGRSSTPRSTPRSERAAKASKTPRSSGALCESPRVCGQGVSGQGMAGTPGSGRGTSGRRRPGSGTKSQHRRNAEKSHPFFELGGVETSGAWDAPFVRSPASTPPASPQPASAPWAAFQVSSDFQGKFGSSVSPMSSPLVRALRSPQDGTALPHLDLDSAPAEAAAPGFGCDGFVQCFEQFRQGVGEVPARLKLAKQQLKAVPPVLYADRSMVSRGVGPVGPHPAFICALLELDLSANKLREIPPELGLLHNLKFLDVSNNRLRVLPPELRRLGHLVSFCAHNNELDTLEPNLFELRSHDLRPHDDPSEVGSGLRRLQSLDLSQNSISELCLELGDLLPARGRGGALTRIALAGNPLASVPLAAGQDATQLLRFFETLERVRDAVNRQRKRAFLAACDRRLLDHLVQLRHRCDQGHAPSSPAPGLMRRTASTGEIKASGSAGTREDAKRSLSFGGPSAAEDIGTSLDDDLIREGDMSTISTVLGMLCPGCCPKGDGLVGALGRNIVHVLALFSCPRGTQKLDLMREMLQLFRKMPLEQREVVPACRWPMDVESALEQTWPRVLSFSGHGFPGHGSTLVFEHEAGDGSVARFSPKDEDFISLLNRQVAPRLCGVLLNACQTAAIGRAIVRAPRCRHLSVVAWETVIEDPAANAFSLGFFEALDDDGSSDALDLDDARWPSTIEAAFAKGCAAFCSAGFTAGDPAEWRNRDHNMAAHFGPLSGSVAPFKCSRCSAFSPGSMPQCKGCGHLRFRPSCTSCRPPVNGIPVLLQFSAGQVWRSSLKQGAIIEKEVVPI